MTLNFAVDPSQGTESPYQPQSPAVIAERGDPEPVSLNQIPVHEQIIPAEYGTLKDLDIVKQTIEILDEIYPGHYWAVKCEGGILHIKNLSFHPNWGIARTLGGIEFDAGVFRREVIRAAGEYLERAGLARRSWNGDAIKHMEGVPAQYQPGGSKSRAITL
jgi:hypothetical protein